MSEIIITLKSDEAEEENAVVQPAPKGIIAPTYRPKHLARRFKKSAEIEVYDGAYFLTEAGLRELAFDFEVPTFPYTDHGYSAFTFDPDFGAYPTPENYEEVYDFIRDIPAAELKDKFYKIKKADLSKYGLIFSNEIESTTDEDWTDDDKLKLPANIANSSTIFLQTLEMSPTITYLRGDNPYPVLTKITNVFDYNAPPVAFDFSGSLKMFLMPKLFYAIRGVYYGTPVPPVNGLYLQSIFIHGSFRVATRRNLLDPTFEYFGETVMNNLSYFKDYFANEFEYETNTIRYIDEFENYTATANMMGGTFTPDEDEAKAYMAMPNLPVTEDWEPIIPRSLELIVQKENNFYYFWS